MLAGLVNQYRVLTTIGAGGMGVVYKAIDTRLNRPVAIKAIRESDDITSDAVIRLRAEALAAASLDHPYICKIYELLDTESGTLIVMEYIEGETLAALLHRGVPPLADALRYGSEIAEGLADAHGHGLIHRDVKPSNVMITTHGHVKLLDFGVVRVNAPGSGATTTHSALTRPGGAPGTPLYMAPEQALGLAITPRADIFSLGIILFECLTGHLPFDGGTRDAYVHAMLTGQKRRIVDLAPSVPEPVRRLVDACLQGEPSRRPESATVVGSGLRRAADAMSGSSAYTVPARARWRVVVQAVAAVVAVWALVAAFLLWRSSRRSDRPPLSIMPAVTAPGANSNPRISPDGRWLSFLSDRDGPLKLFVQAMEGGKPMAVDVPGAALVTHTWSPDGREFACIARQHRDVFLEIVPAFFGGLPRISIPLVPAPEIARAIRWVGDDVFIDANLGAAGHHLWRVDLDAQRVDDLTAKWDRLGYRSFDVSPDGRLVVFVARRDSQDDLWTIHADGSGLRRLTNDRLPERSPLWLGNTGAIVFQSNRSGQLDLWQIDARSGSVAQITSSQTAETPSDTTADGSVIAFEQIAEGATMWLLDRRGAQARQLTADALSDFWPSVSADVVAFQRTRPLLREGYQFLDSRVLVARIIGGDHLSDPDSVADGFAARLSPDATSVAYWQRSADPRYTVLQVRSLQTAETRTLTQTAILPGMSFLFPVDWIEQKVAWGPVGRRLYFIDSPEGRQRIARADLATGSTSPIVIAEEHGVLSDIRVSADGDRIGYLEWTHGAFQIRVRNMQSGEDVVVRTEPGPVFAVFLRGWADNDRSLLFLRTERNADGTDHIEVFQTGTAPGSRIAVGSIDGALTATTRLNVAGRELYVTCVEAGVHNVFVMTVPGGQLRQLTDNQQRGVSFTGIAPLPDGSIVYSRPETRRDVYLARNNAR